MSNFENAIKAAPDDERCIRCEHRIGLDDIGYCELWECSYEPINPGNIGGYKPNENS